MPQHFDPKRDWESLRNQIAGLGEHSFRKSYYPELQKRLLELEEEVRHRKEVEVELQLKNTLLEEEIAQRQLAEMAASVERDNVRAIFEAAPIGMMILNESCRVVDANRTMETICGKNAQELLGLVPGQVFQCAHTAPDSRGCGHARECDECALREMVQAVMKAHEARYGIEMQLLRRDGEAIRNTWLKISAEPITVSGKGCAIIAVDDVTELRRIQDDLLRTSKLESLGELAGGIAHDFNNMLTAVIANLSMAILQPAREETVQRLQHALQAAERATDLTRQLLTFSKGGSPVKRLASVADIVRESAGFALRGSNVACTFDIPEDVWAAEVDGGQLSQVISNLLINADQAMPTGGIISISMENVRLTARSRTMPAGRYLKIVIADQGIGIPSEHLTRIFDPYFTTKSSGNGLGLATTHSIIARHGGCIEVTSLLGQGTTFTIYLPASDRKVEELPKRKQPLRQGTGRILAMDDENDIRKVVCKMLEVLGYECVTCKNGQEACNLYRAALEKGERFSAVIMDLTVAGGMGGVEAMAKIREMDPGARGIIASGYSGDTSFVSYRDHGFSLAISKPFTIHQLAEGLAEVLSSQEE